MNTRRNGEIEIMRFIFAIGIVMFHFNGRYSGAGIFGGGYIAVEFFFVLSGFLMARSAKKALERGDGNNISSSTWDFTFKKLKAFYKYYFFGIIVQLILTEIIVKHRPASEILTSLLRSAPTLTLTFYTLSWPDVSLYLGSTWFLSAMIICMFVLYPFIMKNFDMAIKVVLPILFVFVAGYVLHQYGKSLHNIKSWNTLFYSGIPKSFAEIAFGASCYYLPEKINHYRQNVFVSQKVADFLFTALKWGSILIVFLYSLGVYNKIYDLDCLILCAIFVSISFSDAGFHFPGNRITDFLGQMSLPFFIFHKIILNLLLKIIPKHHYPISKYLILILCTFIICIIMKILADYGWKATEKLFVGKILKRPKES